MTGGGLGQLRLLQIFGIGLLLTLGAHRASAQQQNGFDLEKTKRELSRLIESALKEQGIPSISIALVKDNAIVWKAAFGYANVRTKTLATPDTIYCTGSTFKSATAAALMQLAEQGKFKLDQPVNQYLGEIQIRDRVQGDKPVTFVHMLSHWSGLTADAVTKPIWGRELPNSLEKMVSGLYSVRPPETKWEYNNSAFGMAGLLVQKISGTEYEKYMVDHVLAPLGVTTPHPVYPSPEMVELMALPYEPGGSAQGKPQPVAQVHFDVYPAGDIYLTAEDMARFLGALVNGGVFNGHRILSETSVKEMQTPRFGGVYGFGLGISKDPHGHTIIDHKGGIPGQSSVMMGDVDAHVGVYYMSNSGAPSEIAGAALKLLQGEDYVPPAAPKVITVDPSVLDTYLGVYELNANAVFTVTREGAKLLIEKSGDPAKQELLAETPIKFVIKNEPAIRITFVKDESGAIDHLLIEVPGRSLIAKRKK